MNEAPMQHRDSDPNQVRIVREIPLWGILCVLGAFAGQAVLMWSSQREQAAAIVALTAQVKDANASIRELSGQVGTANNQNLKLGYDLELLKQRLERIEMVRK